MKKLYRSRKNKVIGGVASGLAEYFDIDAAIMRLIFAFLAVVFPTFIIAYILAWIIVPEQPSSQVQAKGTPDIEASAAPANGCGSAELKNQGADNDKDLPPTAAEIAGSREAGREPVQGAGSPKAGSEVAAEVKNKTLNETGNQSQDQPQEAMQKPEQDKSRQFLGYFLIAIGSIVILRRYVPSFGWRMPIYFIRTWWPALIIVLGLALIFSALRGGSGR